MGNFRIGAVPHPGAFVDRVKPNLDPLVGRHGLVKKYLMAESCCLGLARSGLGFFLCQISLLPIHSPARYPSAPSRLPHSNSPWY